MRNDRYAQGVMEQRTGSISAWLGAGKKVMEEVFLE